MIYNESNLLFDFSDAHWSYLMQYDVETDFKKIRDGITGTKAVDFIGVFNQNILTLIEVKNFRGHRIANKTRIENGDDPIEQEVALKVRDTIAGIVGAARNATHKKEYWENYLAFLQNKNKRVEVVLWLEKDADPRPNIVQIKREKSKGGTVTSKLKQKLSWLTPHVSVSDADNNVLPNMIITFQKEENT
jgi:hypothetical protein